MTKELERGKPVGILHESQLRVKDISSLVVGANNKGFVFCLDLYFPTNYENFG